MTATIRASVAGILLAFTVLSGPAPRGRPDPPREALEAVTGRGTGDKAACLACAIGVLGAGGLTFGGVLLIALVYPEAVAACGVLCYRALAT